MGGGWVQGASAHLPCLRRRPSSTWGHGGRGSADLRQRALAKDLAAGGEGACGGRRRARRRVGEGARGGRRGAPPGPPTRLPRRRSRRFGHPGSRGGEKKASAMAASLPPTRLPPPAVGSGPFLHRPPRGGVRSMGAAVGGARTSSRGRRFEAAAAAVAFSIPFLSLLEVPSAVSGLAPSSSSPQGGSWALGDGDSGASLSFSTAAAELLLRGDWGVAGTVGTRWPHVPARATVCLSALPCCGSERWRVGRGG
ncbi:hypothetical protein PVAP13_7NG019678 [Panicum virgatum]|uniref:Uncharacterized protein n=1 Tax=Panicum virgatum TaxID=38727 RepID=A0A8T0PRM7_PANVG|nr:hypothetical protein PVAP13_7NG019678 [Panicum virgatum]